MTTANSIRRLLRRAGFDVGRWPRPHDLDGAVAAVIAARNIQCVLDVGANRGQFGKRLRALGYRGRIESFEPSSAALPALTGVAAADGSWGVHPTALGAEEATASLHRFIGSEFNSLHPSLPAGESRFVGMRADGTETVTVSTLMAEKTALGPVGPFLLKSDTQGHDLEVLRGDPGLGAIVAVLVELSAYPIYAGQPTMAAVIEYLTGEDFRPVTFEPVNRDADRLGVIEFDALFLRH